MSKTKKPKVNYINMGPFPTYVGWTTSPEAFAAEMKRLKVGDQAYVARETAAATTHLFDRPGQTLVIVTLPEPSGAQTQEQYAALVAHEAVHVMQYMHEALGDLGKEAEAYIVQTVVQEVLQAVWESSKSRSHSPS